jgi:hypothetical protein
LSQIHNLEQKSWRDEFRTKMIKYSTSALLIQGRAKKVVETQMYRMHIMKQYWEKVKEVIVFCLNHPKHKKKIENSIVFKIYWDETIFVDERIRKYIREYKLEIRDKRYKFIEK